MVMYPTSKTSLAKPELELDNVQEAGFCDFFRKMPTRAPGTIRLFFRKDEYYSAHGEDALYVADNVYHTKTVIKYLGGRSSSSKHGNSAGLPSCTLSKAVATNFLREALTSRQLRVEIWTPASSSKSREGWVLDKSASPGNLQDVEDLLFQNTEILEAPMCLSIVFRVKEGIKHVGIAFADSSERRLGVAEFVETEIFSNTESLLIQLGVKEVIFPSEEKGQEVESAKLHKLIDRCLIPKLGRKRADFAAKNIEQDLNSLLKGGKEVSKLPVFEQKLALSACSGLIAHLDLLSSDANRGAYELIDHHPDYYMKLDAAAVRALTLMPDGPTGALAAPIAGGKASRDSAASLFGLLNKCKTGQGTRLLAMWLKQPLVNLHQIETRQQLVGGFFDDSIVRSVLRDDLLKAMPDFQRISKRFQAKKATLEDVVRAYQAVTKLEDFIYALRSIGKEKHSGLETTDEELMALIADTYLNKLEEDYEHLKKFIELVETTIDVDEINKSHEIKIKPNFSESLLQISARIDQVKKLLEQQFDDAADDLGIDTGAKKNPLNFENHSIYGHCFRLTRKEASIIKGKKKYIELANRTNGCYFTTRDLKELNEEAKALNDQYARKQSTLAKEVTEIAGSFAPLLEGLNGTIAHLDVITSLAHVANNAPTAYVKPTVLEKGTGNLILKESRHPCLEALPDINFIPNDVDMMREESEFQIITGANTGGKSVYLRQIGCIALLAQIGSFVPASEAQVPIFDCILARVGAGDSQLKGISTFMAEMLETATILKSATKDSLIIIDELGRGTSTYDGFGLAWAISEHIAKEIRSFTLFATHFHDLTTLSEQIPHVKNLHVMAHVEEKSDSITGRDIVMLYKVQPGISDQSFGIHVAELAKFPQEVVRLAKRKADELEETIEEANDGQPSASQKEKFTPEEIAAGTELVAKILREWKETAEEQLPSAGTDGMDEDISEEAVAQKELETIKSVFGKYTKELEASPWVASVLMETY